MESECPWQRYCQVGEPTLSVILLNTCILKKSIIFLKSFPHVIWTGRRRTFTFASTPCWVPKRNEEVLQLVKAPSGWTRSYSGGNLGSLVIIWKFCPNQGIGPCTRQFIVFCELCFQSYFHCCCGGKIMFHMLQDEEGKTGTNCHGSYSRRGQLETSNAQC